MLQGYSAHLGYDMVITYLRSAVQVQVGNGYRLGHPYFGIYKTWWCGKPFKTHVQINRVCLLYMGAQHFPELEFVQFFGNFCWMMGSSDSHCLLFQNEYSKPMPKRDRTPNTPQTTKKIGVAWGNPFRGSNMFKHFHPSQITNIDQSKIYSPANCKPNP